MDSMTNMMSQFLGTMMYDFLSGTATHTGASVPMNIPPPSASYPMSYSMYPYMESSTNHSCLQHQHHLLNRLCLQNHLLNHLCLQHHPLNYLFLQHHLFPHKRVVMMMMMMISTGLLSYYRALFSCWSHTICPSWIRTAVPVWKGGRWPLKYVGSLKKWCWIWQNDEAAAPKTTKEGGQRLCLVYLVGGVCSHSCYH